MKFVPSTIVAAIAAVSLATAANAGNILIVNGAGETSEPSTTASITQQISQLHIAVGNTVTVVDTTPLSLAGYQQVWDVRFSNSSPIDAPLQAEYVNYLASGGGIFAMGENAFFGTRNESVISLIAAAGGGLLTYIVPGDSQTVIAPFTGPNAVSTLQYSVAGGLTTAGTGQFITSNASGGSGVAFGVGTLANAQAGALTAIFDVNFLQTDANFESQQLAKNLIGFIGGQVDPGGTVPEPATWALLITGFGLVGGLQRRRRAALAA